MHQIMTSSLDQQAVPSSLHSSFQPFPPTHLSIKLFPSFHSAVLPFLHLFSSSPENILSSPSFFRFHLFHLSPGTGRMQRSLLRPFKCAAVTLLKTLISGLTTLKRGQSAGGGGGDVLLSISSHITSAVEYRKYSCTHGSTLWAN